MTNHNTEEKDLYGELAITSEHVGNNKAVRAMLAERGIRPENLPAAEDIKKLERRVKSEEKKLAKESGFTTKKKLKSQPVGWHKEIYERNCIRNFSNAH